MRSIAIFNQKGGVGKTTTTVNVAAALAQQGARVLLIDMDPQTHATMHLGVELADDAPSVYDVLTSGTSVLETVQTAREGLLVIPAHLDLVAAEIELAEREERETVLARAVRPLYDELDYCLIDCAPSLGLLALNALAATDEVIIPLQPHFLALQGLGKLLETVELVSDGLNDALRVSGVLFSMYEANTRLAQEVAGDVQAFLDAAEPDRAWYGARLFDAKIRRNIKLAECPSFGQTIFDYAPQSHGATDYAALAAELAAMTPPERVVQRATESTAALGVDAIQPPAQEEFSAADVDNAETP